MTTGKLRWGQVALAILGDEVLVRAQTPAGNPSRAVVHLVLRPRTAVEPDPATETLCGRRSAKRRWLLAEAITSRRDCAQCARYNTTSPLGRPVRPAQVVG